MTADNGWEQLGNGLAQKTRGFVERQLADPLSRLADLETRLVRLEADLSARDERIAQLEARPTAVRYRDVYEAGVEYEAGDLVTDRGSLFFCKAGTLSRPPSSDWMLCVKRGEAPR